MLGIDRSMKCFRHNNSEAIGICKNCGKGLCTFCVVDLGYGLACIDSCQDAVKAIHQKKNHRGIWVFLIRWLLVRHSPCILSFGHHDVFRFFLA
jgi:hypothetical protein